MYQPPGRIWLPIGQLTWGWYGVATNNGSGTFVANHCTQYFNTYVAMPSNSAFPTWQHVQVPEVDWVTVLD